MANMITRQVIQAMEKIAPLSLAETAWDNVGLLIESPSISSLSSSSSTNLNNETKVFLTIDLTQATLTEAISHKSNVIVAYHPPLFRSIKRLTMADEKQSLALLCIAHGISVYSPHTALDACLGGINDWLAYGAQTGRKVGGSGEVAGFFEWARDEGNKTVPVTVAKVGALGGQPEGRVGSGRITTLKTPTTFGELVERVKGLLGLAHVRVAVPRGKSMDTPVKTVGICAGSGSSVLNGVKADVYFTGEMSHHDVLSAVAANTFVILCEHTNTERGYLHQVLQEKLKSVLLKEGGLSDQAVDIIVSSTDKDPLVVV